MTPYLALVLSGYAVFIVVLGGVWIRQALDDRRAAKPASVIRAVAPRDQALDQERRRAA